MQRPYIFAIKKRKRENDLEKNVVNSSILGAKHLGYT